MEHVYHNSFDEIEEGCTIANWTFLGIAQYRGNNLYFKCQCECGKIEWIRKNQFVQMDFVCAICVTLPRNKQAPRRSGLAGNRTYESWKYIRSRYRKGNKNSAKPDVKLCDRWNDYDNFLADMGERKPGYRLARLDNRKDFEPTNCRWQKQSISLGYGNYEDE